MVATLSHKALLTRQTVCGLLSILSALTRESPSMRMLRVMTVVRIHPSALEAEIINMMIICSFAARSTDAPPRRAPVIIPGIDMIPSTLQRRAMRSIGSHIRKETIDLIWLMVGIRETRSVSIDMDLQASHRVAPKARYISILSLLSLFMRCGVRPQCRFLYLSLA